MSNTYYPAGTLIFVLFIVLLATGRSFGQPVDRQFVVHGVTVHVGPSGDSNDYMYEFPAGMTAAERAPFYRWLFSGNEDDAQSADYYYKLGFDRGRGLSVGRAVYTHNDAESAAYRSGLRAGARRPFICNSL